MEKLIAPLFREPAKHLHRLLTRPAYRTLCRLVSRHARTPRFSERIITVNNWTLRVPDVASFLSTYKSIFVEQTYAFACPETDAPRILDCGANIGLSVLYFKSLFPKARITAFEADARVFEVLKHNVRSNGFDDVELIDRAVWSSDTTLHFHHEGADAGRVEDTGGVEVHAVRLRPHLEREDIHFLKVDIEGAEVEVLRDCAGALARVRRAFVEHHSTVGRPQHLGELINWFEAAGFRVHVKPEFNSASPLLKLHVHGDLNMDLQLNLYFQRDAIAKAAS